MSSGNVLDILDEKLNENPPRGWTECGCCNCYHPSKFYGDCRDDENRWPFTRKMLSSLSKLEVAELSWMVMWQTSYMPANAFEYYLDRKDAFDYAKGLARPGCTVVLFAPGKNQKHSRVGQRRAVWRYVGMEGR